MNTFPELCKKHASPPKELATLEGRPGGLHGSGEVVFVRQDSPSRSCLHSHALLKQKRFYAFALHVLPRSSHKIVFCSPRRPTICPYCRADLRCRSALPVKRRSEGELPIFSSPATSLFYFLAASGSSAVLRRSYSTAALRAVNCS